MILSIGYLVWIHVFHNFKLLKVFISKYKNTLKKLPKFKCCISNNDFINKIYLTNNDFKLILNHYKLSTIKKNKLLFSSQSVISRKQKFNKINKHDFFELSSHVYSTQSFTDIKNIKLSFSSHFIGQYNTNGGRIIIYKLTDDIRLLNIGNSLKHRIQFMTFFTKLIFGISDLKLFKNEKSKDFWCYKISCIKGSLGEPLVNLILLQ